MSLTDILYCPLQAEIKTASIHFLKIILTTFGTLHTYINK